MKTKPCTICTHPRRVEIEKEALTKKSYADRTRAAQKIEPELTYQNVRRHLQKCQLTVEASVFLQKQFSNLEALNDIIARGVGKAVVRASDVIAAVKVKTDIESEKDRMRLFERFVMAFAANPKEAVKDPAFKGILADGPIIGKMKPIDGNTKGITEETLPSKE